MKKTKIIYWILTGLFLALMLFSSIPDVLCVPDAITFVTHLGYPVYFVPFIGVAKILGVVAILIPGFPRIKEWAYAGLIFDLIAATFSIIVVEGFSAGILPMFIFIVMAFASYLYYHKMIKGVKTPS